jgi:hypothetical protein
MTSAAHAHWTARRNDAHRAVSSSSFARRPSAEKELNVSTAPPFFFCNALSVYFSLKLNVFSLCYYSEIIRSPKLCRF